MFFIGEIYEYGNGVSKDLEEAITWYKKAADKEYRDAKNALEKLGIK
jgi:uncharacterized protein